MRKNGLRSMREHNENTKKFYPKSTLTTASVEMLKFMCMVIRKVEIRVPVDDIKVQDRKNEILYFFIHPKNYYLDEKEEFLLKLDLENSRQELLKYSNVIMQEMDLNFDLNSKSPFMYYICKDEVLTINKIFAWLVGLVINLVCLFTLQLNDPDDDGNKGDRKLGRKNWLRGTV